jgi:hypothetical protein
LSLLNRRQRLESSDFWSKRSQKQLQHASLYKAFYKALDRFEPNFIKIKGHTSNRDTKEIWKTTLDVRALLINLSQVVEVELKKYRLFKDEEISLFYQTELLMTPNENIYSMARTIGYVDSLEGETYFFFQVNTEINNYGQHSMALNYFEKMVEQMVVDAWNLSNTLP